MSRKPSSGKRGNLSQYGLLDMSGMDDDEPLDLSDDDIDLEAELAAIAGGKQQRRPRKPPPAPAVNLDAMIAESLKDIPSDDEEVSGDEDDPDLLNELQELAVDDDSPPPRTARPAPPPPSLSSDSSTISVLKDRITNYTAAEKNAKTSGESSRARRFGRALKTLNDLLKQAQAGKNIDESEIPPPVTISKPADTASQPTEQPAEPRPQPTEQPAEQPSPEEPPSLVDLSPVSPPKPQEVSPMEGLSDEKQRGMQLILRRKEEFKAAALASKHSGDKMMALEYLKVVKQFDMVVEAYKSGQEMDLNEMPTPEGVAAALRSQKIEGETQNSTAPEPEAASSGELITASTMDEGLRQRLAAFQQQEAKAKEEGNSSKARRMGRIVKQYQEAIKLHAAGRTVDVDELPTPAGYGPLPQGDKPAAPGRAPAAPPAPGPRAAPPAPPALPRASRHDKQLAFLLLRQKQFKEAAINAKKSGDIENAKEYLRAAKGFDAVIEAAKGGLAVDLKSLPLPPKAKNDLEHTFDVVSKEDCGPSDDCPSIDTTADDSDVLSRIIAQLSSQMKMCLANRDHNRSIGNIAEANRFEHLANSVKQDLDLVKVIKSYDKPPPKFHYETREFTVVQCNTDLNENDLELTIVRGIAYNVPNPKEIDTYVKFEFPFPQEAPVSDRTSCIKDTNSPEYNAVFPLSIQRNSRPCLRLFKRHGIKLEVYSRGGWFRSDTLIGTVNVKLAPLENYVTFHEALPLMDGRRAAGGSLEVKLRVRTPLLQPQTEHTKHRWLVIDS